MLDLGWWPAFNLADVFIVLGVAALLLQTTHPVSHDAAPPYWKQEMESGSPA